jgi:hypothetical protein
MDPKAITNILVEELPDETLVYDLDRHRAHCLNPTAAFLLQTADGTKPVAELARMASVRFGEAATEEVISLGLERLQRARLVEWDTAPALPDGISRRQAIRRLAAVGLAVPAVMTIVSPLAAQGGTTIAIGDCALATVGRCCVNNKLCIQNKRGQFACSEPGC